MFSVTTREGGCVAGRDIGVKNSDIKKCPFKSTTQKPSSAAMSDLAPSSVFAYIAENVSPVMGCRVGSIETL